MVDVNQSMTTIENWHKSIITNVHLIADWLSISTNQFLAWVPDLSNCTGTQANQFNGLMLIDIECHLIIRKPLENMDFCQLLLDQA